jgi:hypothetical protein
LDWKQGQWLPVFLLGMGIISWMGRYCSSGPAGPGSNCSATLRIPFWVDMGVVAGFALLMFIWAQLAKLPRKDMLDLVERQSLDAADPDAAAAAAAAG